MKTSALAIWIVWTAILFHVGRATAESSPDPRMEKIFADWQARREQMKTVRYRTSGEHIRPKGTFTDPYRGKPLGPDSPPHDITWPKSVTLLLDFRTSRYREEVDEQPYSQTQGQFAPKGVLTTVFDSGESSTLIPRPPGKPADIKKPDVNTVSGNMRGQSFGSDFWPYFLGHGIVALTTEQHILPGRFAKALDKGAFHVHGEGVFADRSCVVLRSAAWQAGTTGFDELWVDLGRESAVLRQVAYVNDKIAMDIQLNYQQTRAGWLPQNWTVSHAYLSGVIFSIDRMHVDKLEIDPMVTDADFRLDLKPGMVVQQISVPGTPDQITNPKPNPNRPLFRVAPNGSLRPVNGPEPRPLWTFYLAGVVFILALGIAGVFWRRRKARRSAL